MRSEREDEKSEGRWWRMEEEGVEGRDREWIGVEMSDRYGIGVEAKLTFFVGLRRRGGHSCCLETTYTIRLRRQEWKMYRGVNYKRCGGL